MLGNLRIAKNLNSWIGIISVISKSEFNHIKQSNLHESLGILDARQSAPKTSKIKRITSMNSGQEFRRVLNSSQSSTMQSMQKPNCCTNKNYDILKLLGLFPLLSFHIQIPKDFNTIDVIAFDLVLNSGRFLCVICSKITGWAFPKLRPSRPFWNSPPRSLKWIRLLRPSSPMTALASTRNKLPVSSIIIQIHITLFLDFITQLKWFDSESNVVRIDGCCSPWKKFLWILWLDLEFSRPLHLIWDSLIFVIQKTWLIKFFWHNNKPSQIQIPSHSALECGNNTNDKTDE